MTHYLDAAMRGGARRPANCSAHIFSSRSTSTRRGARHQTGDRCAGAGIDHAASARKIFRTTRFMAKKESSATRRANYQWVVDPLDGTVNYFYGIPHFCVSIALRCRERNYRRRDLRSDARRNVDGAKRRRTDIERPRFSRERARRSGAKRSFRSDFPRPARPSKPGMPLLQANGATRAQVPTDGQRRARHGLSSPAAASMLTSNRESVCGTSRRAGFWWKLPAAQSK